MVGAPTSLAGTVVTKLPLLLVALMMYSVAHCGDVVGGVKAKVREERSLRLSNVSPGAEGGSIKGKEKCLDFAKCANEVH